MPLIRDGEIVEDRWLRIADEAPLPATGCAIVSVERLAHAHNEPGGGAARIGVALPNSADPRALAPFLAGVELVALHFPAFTDGRAYSQARILRGELGYRGELRATGNVLADQAAFMRRCGFDSFETDGRQPVEVWRSALRSVTHVYQRGYGDDGWSTRTGDRTAAGHAVRPGTAAPV